VSQLSSSGQEPAPVSSILVHSLVTFRHHPRDASLSVFDCGPPPFNHWLASSPDSHPFPHWPGQFHLVQLIPVYPANLLLMVYTSPALMMEAVCTYVVYFNKSAWHYMPEGCHLHTHRCENLKSSCGISPCVRATLQTYCVKKSFVDYDPWVVMLCSLVGSYQCFGRIYYLHLCGR
jgi:hypothetical protein